MYNDKHKSCIRIVPATLWLPPSIPLSFSLFLCTPLLEVLGDDLLDGLDLGFGHAFDQILDGIHGVLREGFAI